MKKPLTQNKGNLASAYADLKIDENIQTLVDAIYERTNTEYWMSFMEMSNILLQNVEIYYVGNLDEYLSSTRAMLLGMLTSNSYDYGKCAPNYWAMVSSLPYEKKNYFSEHIAQSVTTFPYLNQPIDLLIEVFMNLDSKMKQKWLQLLQSDTQLFCSTHNANNVLKKKKVLKKALNYYCRHQKHVEC